jgi:hypothetical protein
MSVNIPSLPGKKIGSLRESSLHASLKEMIASCSDMIEVPVDGFWIDIVRGNQLIEIQTSNFSSIKPKLTKLLAHFPLHLIYPLAKEKWIIKNKADGISKRRKSPKKGRVEDIFYELVKISNLLTLSNLSFEVLFTREEEIQVLDEKSLLHRNWRRKGWRITDRRLLSVVDRLVFNSPIDYGFFLSSIDDDQSFTSRDLANLLGINIKLSQKMLYCFLRIGLVDEIGKQNRARLYRKMYSEQPNEIK